MVQAMNNTNKVSETVLYDEIHQIFARRFKESYADICHEIETALDSGDIKHAHRLVHNLKSNAGQLRKTSLQIIAAEVEGDLKNEVNNVTKQQMQELERELKKVIEEITNDYF